MTDLRRIDPEDAEDLDPRTHDLLRRWASKRLDITEGDVDRVLVEVTGGCGEGTCEFTTARVEVNLQDGRVFLGPDQGFGLFIRDVVDMDVAEDGSEHRLGHLWTLHSEDGKAVRPPAQPEPQAPKAPRPTEPIVGMSIRVETQADAQGRATSRRTEVYTSNGWVDLQEIVAAYDDAFGPLRRG